MSDRMGDWEDIHLIARRKCPVCNGTGTILHPNIGMNEACQACRGGWVEEQITAEELRRLLATAG